MPSALHAGNNPPAPDQNVHRRGYLENDAFTVPANVVHVAFAASDAQVAYRAVEVNIAVSRFGTRLKCQPLAFQISLLSGSFIRDGGILSHRAGSRKAAIVSNLRGFA